MPRIKQEMGTLNENPKRMQAFENRSDYMMKLK